MINNHALIMTIEKYYNLFIGLMFNGGLKMMNPSYHSNYCINLLGRTN